MSRLNPERLHTKYQQGVRPETFVFPRCYTLTHSDLTGDIFLTIAPEYNQKQISGWYTRFMRDEVLADWKDEDKEPSLHVYCHVSGGSFLGDPAGA